MSDIPEDIRAAAAAIEQRMVNLPQCTRQACEDIMAEALMAERERCARIADKFTAKPVKNKSIDQYNRSVSSIQTARRVASAIRSDHTGTQ